MIIVFYHIENKWAYQYLLSVNMYHLNKFIACINMLMINR